MKIRRLVLGMFATNSYIVYGNRSGECLLIDPADDAPAIMEQMEKESLVPMAVLLTHGHYDHFLAVPALQRAWPGLPVYCSSLDCPAELEEHDMGRTFPTVTALHNVRNLADGQRLNIAGFEIAVMATPGHTRGSVTFLIEDAMFSGDTLFCGSIGRTDFPGGSMEQMRQSLRRLATLSEDYRVYPGHEGISTLEAEKKYNSYFGACV